jgi:phospholipase C
MQKYLATSLSALLIAGQFTAPLGAYAASESFHTTTPIKHVVVIFGENISFDHYFGSYPFALNPPGEPKFVAASNTPSVNGLETDGLMYANPNFLNTTGNGTGASNPFRLDRSQAATNDQDHNYTPEQEAFHGGLMDSFPQYTGTAGPPPASQPTKALVMGYYDGNTVTALWNYAQRFALNDNSYDTNFGPSTPGAINLISGQTNGVTDASNAASTTGSLVQFTGTNIGDLLNAKGITWGFFEGGFDLTAKNANGSTGCARSTTSTVTGVTKLDYIQHHQPFQYYAQSANPQHTRPTSVHTIGVNGDAANHQYDMNDFYAAVKAGNFPAVSFLKAPGYQDAHAGYSDPLDEQTFVVTVINFLMQQPDWSSTAVIINYDDSDGWYDHQLGQIVNQSTSAADALTAAGQCGNGTESALAGPAIAHAQGRCGYGPRLPLQVISPYARQNYVDHTLTDQTSIIRFVEDNWLDGQRIGNGSFDAVAGPLNNMFDFNHKGDDGPFLLNPLTGLKK